MSGKELLARMAIMTLIAVVIAHIVNANPAEGFLIGWLFVGGMCSDWIREWDSARRQRAKD